jgi:hypothetical protein
MAATPEEVALELSRATFEAQRQAEVKLRERATNVLSAASLVVPVAAVAVGIKGSAEVAIPFGAAALAYIVCAKACCEVLFPKNFRTGIAGGEFLKAARDAKPPPNLEQAQATAASWLDKLHAQNQPTLRAAAVQVRKAIDWLMLEIVAVAIALVVTLVV